MAEKLLLVIIVGAILLAIASLYIWSISWAIGDAQKRGQTGFLPVLLFYVLGPLAIPAWLFYRPLLKLEEKKCGDYQNVEDALSAAARLDVQGNWKAAIELYRISAERWPEHLVYAKQCIEQIERKQIRS